MTNIEIMEGFHHPGQITKTVEEIVKEFQLHEKLDSINIKHPPLDHPIDMNYLFPEERRLELEIVDSLDNLEGRIRHELMHVVDQLDADFGYKRKREPGSGTTQLRRYKYLWNVYIDSRLQRAGKPAYATKEAREEELGECWPELSEETRLALFEHLWILQPLAQKQLLQLSNNIFKFSKDLKALSKGRGERLRRFKTLEDLRHFARWGDVAEG
ncbi:MAG TPA: hypothetical protein ACFYD1_01510 [Candidatus Hypogeohydataceae bacterium YC38]|nr:hypothetical protein [Candidatus Brocadiales bacterium]